MLIILVSLVAGASGLAADVTAADAAPGLLVGVISTATVMLKIY